MKRRMLDAIQVSLGISVVRQRLSSSLELQSLPLLW